MHHLFSLPARLVSSRLGTRRGGYIFLISVLTIGSIAAATAVSMILLGLASQQNSAALVESTQAEQYAQTCIERALQSLRSDPHYIGEQTFTFSRGTCRLYSIGGADNEARTICAEGVTGVSTRRMEVKVAKLLPSTLIDTWREVLAFSLCS